jgi:hypothetical protein
MKKTVFSIIIVLLNIVTALLIVWNTILFGFMILGIGGALVATILILIPLSRLDIMKNNWPLTIVVTLIMAGVFLFAPTDWYGYFTATAALVLYFATGKLNPILVAKIKTLGKIEEEKQQTNNPAKTS